MERIKNRRANVSRAGRMAGLVGGTLLGLSTMALPTPAPAIELVPSVGLTRAVETDDVKTQVGLALRAPLLPAVMQVELGGAYRSESRFGGDLEVRQWPITASLWLTPLPSIYAGGGAGWYHTSLDYREPIEDETTQDFGVHVGGGIKMPLAPSVALDLGGRYVFLQTQESPLVPDEFDPDFWTMTLGLAIGL